MYIARGVVAARHAEFISASNKWVRYESENRRPRSWTNTESSSAQGL